ncbi:MAG: hypothetical protein UT48_C0048G0004 [Parcubacteria group bacterium GW2011_GWE2_39_37]|uniref:YdbS-like PH domain-containing protein n=1 Tax=Candidatus Falkowbacteria bacterium GW2011_GWF2_39_8 TaxID=1618642 RepID=A0A0G0SC13_9BACT|nr:MAG: hypothetical protein UT48_C0048G0004 [Parcubacteria group bacterium GW2011_GWE2_39_37]KKR32265.1 MAG: hypothetical protein UT64_C0038G0003 [Candidatus Falkowbacteria bacterium GW2011_GWF2_39_8]
MLSLNSIPNQLPGEKVIKVLRRDIFNILKKLVYFLFFIALMVVFVFFVNSIMPDVTNQVYYPVLLLAGSVYVLFIWLFAFFSFIDYYLDVWIITNERIINIEQEGFFSRTVSEERLFRIQDVTSEVKGVFPTIFSFGNIYIQTAGEKERFVFEQVPEADSVRELIIKLAESDRERASGSLKKEELGIL